jgi:hypothetical protein
VYKYMSAVHPKSYQQKLMSLRAVVGYKTSHFSPVTIFFNIFARRFSSKMEKGSTNVLFASRLRARTKNKKTRTCDHVLCVSKTKDCINISTGRKRAIRMRL